MDQLNKKFDEIIEIIEEYQSSYKYITNEKLMEAQYWCNAHISNGKKENKHGNNKKSKQDIK